MTTNATVLIIVVVLIAVISIMYLFILFEMYKNKKFIFAPYQPSAPPDSFKPLGSVTPMTPQEIAERNALINNRIRDTQLGVTSI